MRTYTEDHLIEQPAIQLIQHELGWNVGGNIEHRTPNIEHRSEEKRKTRTNPTLQRLNPDLPVEAIEGAVEEMEILNDEIWILNERGRRKTVPRQNPALSLAEVDREIDKLLRSRGWVLFALEPERQCNRLVINEFLFELKTSVADSPLGETQRLSEIPVRKLMKSVFSRNRENGINVKIGLSFTGNSLFTTT